MQKNNAWARGALTWDVKSRSAQVNSLHALRETLREAALALVDDPEVARCLKEIQAETAREGGTQRAADLIEAELSARQA